VTEDPKKTATLEGPRRPLESAFLLKDSSERAPL